MCRLHFYTSVVVFLLLQDTRGDRSESGYSMILGALGSKNVTIPSGSNVIFQCLSKDALPANSRIAWMRQENGKYKIKANIDYKQACSFNNGYYPSITITAPCTPYEFNVRFENISVQDSGNWSCRHIQLPSGKKQSKSDFIYLHVKPPEEPTTLSLSTLPETSSSTLPETSSSSLSSMPPAQPLAANSPDVAVIGGSAGAAFVVLAAAVTGCLVMKAKRSPDKNPQSVTTNTRSDCRGKDRNSEMVMIENIVYESHDLQPEGDNALIQDDSSPNTDSQSVTINTRSDSRTKARYSEMVMEENIMYESHDLQPEGEYALIKDDASPETGAQGDVYSEVRKTVTQEKGFQPPAEITDGDVYSVVKKPPKP